MALRLLRNLGTRKHKRSQLDGSTHSPRRPFARQITPFSSRSAQHASPIDFSDSDSDSVGRCPSCHSRAASTSSASSSSPTSQHSVDLLFDPSYVLDIRPMPEDGADLEGPASIGMQSTTSEPEPFADPPPPYIYSASDGSPLPMCILMIPVHETLLGGQEATALLKALREEQILQLQAGNGFAGFNAAELERWERWEEVVD